MHIVGDPVVKASWEVAEGLCPHFQTYLMFKMSRLSTLLMLCVQLLLGSLWHFIDLQNEETSIMIIPASSISLVDCYQHLSENCERTSIP